MIDDDDSLFEDGWEPPAPPAHAGEDRDEDEAASPPPVAEDGGSAEATLEAVTALCALLRAATDAGPEGEEAARVAERAAVAVDNAGPPFALRFVGPAVFRDRALVVPDAGLAAELTGLSGVMARGGAGVLRFEGPATPGELLSLARAMRLAAQGTPAALARLSTPSLRCAPHAAARKGGDPRQLDPEVQASGLLADAAQTLDRILANPGMWPWREAIHMVRQLDRAGATHPAAALRACELDPSDWTPARAAISAALQCLLTLGNLRVHPAVRRAATHALLALGGALRPGEAADPLAAARELLPRMTRPWSQDGRGEVAPPVLTPHQLRVCALVHAFAVAESPGALRGVARLLYLLLCLAGDRLGDGRTVLDQLAIAAADTTRGFDTPWIAALVATHRQLPVGSGVQLAGGRFAVVLDPGRSGDPWRPIVQSGADISTPDAPVRPLASP